MLNRPKTSTAGARARMAALRSPLRLRRRQAANALCIRSHSDCVLSEYSPAPARAGPETDRTLSRDPLNSSRRLLAEQVVDGGLGRGQGLRDGYLAQERPLQLARERIRDLGVVGDHRPVVGILLGPDG